MLYRDRPQLWVVSPPCTFFSQLKNLSPNGLPAQRCPEDWENAKFMFRFAVGLCLIQKRAGQAFVFEHPRSATSWELVEELQGLLEDPEVHESLLDVCCFGMEAVD